MTHPGLESGSNEVMGLLRFGVGLVGVTAFAVVLVTITGETLGTGQEQSPILGF